MRGDKPNREAAAPRRPKSRPGPIPTLGQLAAEASWVWVYCTARDCHHQAPLKLAGLLACHGEDASSDILRVRTRCSKCSALGATIRLPSWIGSGTEPFPGS